MLIDLRSDLAIGRKGFAQERFPWPDALAFDQTGAHLAVAIGDLLIVFAVADGTRTEEHRLDHAATASDQDGLGSSLLEPFRDPYLNTRALFFTAGGDHLVLALGRTGSGFEEIEVHHRRTNQRVLRVHDPDDVGDEDAINRCHAMAVSPSGDHVALAGSRSSVTLFDLSRGGKRVLLESEENEGPPIASMAFDPSGARLALARGGSVDVLDVASAELLFRHEFPLVAPIGGSWDASLAPVKVAFSADGSTLILAQAGDRPVTYLVWVGCSLIKTLPLAQAGAFDVECIDPEADFVWWRRRSLESDVLLTTPALIGQSVVGGASLVPVDPVDIFSYTAVALSPDGTTIARALAPGAVIAPLRLRAP